MKTIFPVTQAGLNDSGAIRDSHWAREIRDVEGNGLLWCGRIPEGEAHKIVGEVVRRLNAYDELAAKVDRLSLALLKIKRLKTRDGSMADAAKQIASDALDS